jgi:hypothetical protein
VLFMGVDWAEDHHDVCVMAEDGAVLGKRRVSDSVAGIGELHGLIAEQAAGDASIIVGIDVDRGLVVWSLLEAGYEVYAVNPMASARYRDRHATSGAKSDPGDAKVLADLVRTDRHNHRPIAGDSNLAEGVSPWLGPNRAPSGAVSASSMRCARPCASTTPGRWPLSAPIWPARTRCRSSRSPRHPSSVGACRAGRLPRRALGGIRTPNLLIRSIHLGK